jgi:prevent-host-death family protein
MKKIGLAQARIHLSKIARRVKQTGKPVTLTKRGEPYVDLVPHHSTAANRRPQADVLADLEKLRRELPKSSFNQIKADASHERH